MATRLYDGNVCMNQPELFEVDDETRKLRSEIGLLYPQKDLQEYLNIAFDGDWRHLLEENRRVIRGLLKMKIEPDAAFMNDWNKIKFNCCVCMEEKNDIPSKKCIHHKKHTDRICEKCDARQVSCPLCRTPYT